MMTVQSGEAEAFSKQNGKFGGKVNGDLRWLKSDEKLGSSKTSLHSNGSTEKFHINGFTSTESITEVEVKTIVIKLLSNDKRFGFSVVGGSDIGFPARIDDISEGSPAARSPLQTNDEIMEVNGIPVTDATHTDVIMEIHKSFQKKLITLKIRRYLDADTLDNINDYDDGGFERGTLEIHNGGYIHERGVDVEEDPRYAKRNIPKPLPMSTGIAVTSSFVNPAFDKDDIDDEDLESSMAKPTATRPGTLPFPSFIVLVEHLKNKMLKTVEQDDVNFTRNLFVSDEFQSAIRAHNIMTRIQDRHKHDHSFKPKATNSQFLLSEVRHSLLAKSDDPEANELLELMNKHTMQSFLLAHDRLALRESLNTFSDGEDSDDNSLTNSVNDYSDFEEETVKIVQIDKTNDPLGATVKKEGDAVLIGRIVKGGAAEKSGLFHEGDEILEINGIPVKGKSVNEVVEILREIEGTLTFLLVPGDSKKKSKTREKNAFFRAQFDYDPQDDNYIPCREIGLPFRKGEILEILNQEDPNWWQARKVNVEANGLAGLIPSKTFQQQREATKVTVREVKEPETAKQKKKCFCLPGKKKKTKTTESAPADDFSLDEILAYEEMVEVQPDQKRKRPIVLIGPPKVGRKQLRQKLINSEPGRFAPAITHTTQEPKHGQVNGRDHYFVSQNDFQNLVKEHKFVEYGPFDDNYFGTSTDAIRDVVNNGQVCVLNLHCQALPVLKNCADLKPYVVFITLPSFEQLRRLRGTGGEPFNPDVRVKDDELIDLIERAREMDINYGHYFDYQIVNQNLDKAYDEVLQLANFIETQPQWMPIAWTN
ncbi:protein PALS1-like [Rhopilema esculentum]|uniref:protein PALS1-like n=1 Tax=Rhopilema esculentum TaxID=499914 RepID=UPI0031D1FF00|eukprot:gene3334-1681_t